MGPFPCWPPPAAVAALGTRGPAQLARPTVPCPPACAPPALTLEPPSPRQGGGGGMNPFGDMGKLMESVKKAQQMVQVETQRLQSELEV